MTDLRVVYDVRGAQTPFHPERGIPRYVTHQFRALAEAPEVSSLRALTDAARPVPEAIAQAVESRRPLADGKIDAEWLTDQPVVHHIGSPFEFDWTHDQLLPPELARSNVVRVVNLYDAVPLICRRTFLQWTHDPWYERLCRYRADLVRIADLVLCISEFAAEEGVRRFGLDEHRVRVIGAAVPEPSRGSTTSASGELRALDPPFVLYTGGAEHPRKNLFRLIRGFAAIPQDLRDGHQLVIAGRIDGAVRDLLHDEARKAGVEDRLVLAGYVPDGLLGELYERCACVVYPSLYEGFGFPIAEAMHRGTPVITSNTSACRELIGDPRATFDPRAEADIARLLSRVLSDAGFADSLRAHGKLRAGRLSWRTVAERTVAAYRELIRDVAPVAAARAPVGVAGRPAFAATSTTRPAP